MDTSTGNCPSDESISEFISGTLTTTVAGDIESHVEVCETCRATIERLSDERDGSDWRPLINPQGRQSAADRSDQIAMPVTRKIGRYELVSPIGRGGVRIALDAHNVPDAEPLDVNATSLTGFFIIEVKDAAEAEHIAATCPALLHGETVHVRPVGHE